MTVPSTVGVIMPVFENASTVASAIESVLAQRPPPDEVIVIDGGSRDGTAAIADGFDGVRVIAQTASGLGQARNQGIAAIDSGLVAFCDGDDRWTADSLGARVRCMDEQQTRAVVGLVVTEAIEGVLPNSRIVGLGQPAIGFTPGALLISRDALDQIGPFDEHLAVGTDSDWFVRLRQSPIHLAVLDQVVLAKGIRAGSLSTDVETYRRDLLAVARRYVERQRRRE